MTNPQAIEDLQKRHRQLEAPALRAMEYVKSPEYQESTKNALEKIKALVEYQIMNEQEALIKIGRIQQIIEAWREPEDSIRRFESVKNSLNELLKRGG